MLSIVACHTIKYYTFIPASSLLGQVFNVGVYSFFIISGYLYGKKDVENFKTWYIKRIQKIHVPIIILTIIDIIILTAYFNQALKISTVIIYLMNLQGIQFISYWISKPFFKEITNLGPLWFATIIMLCYLQIPFLQKIREKYIANKSSTWMIKYGVILACAYAVDYIFEVNLLYFLVFDLGYMISACLEKQVENLSGKVRLYLKALIWCVLGVAFQIGRIILHFIIDGTKTYEIYVSLSHFVFGISIVMCIMNLYLCFPGVMGKIANSRVIRYLDKQSYYIYIVHGIYCAGVTNLYERFERYNISIVTLLFIVLVLATAMILDKMTRVVLSIGNNY